MLNITKNSSCEHFCSDPPVSDATFYFLIFPLLLYGISYLLVSMTVLEFICAQSPNAMKRITDWNLVLNFFSKVHGDWCSGLTFVVS